MIIAISGTPGTGKTEVAKALAERLSYGFIELNRLAQQKDLYSGYDEKRKCKIVDIGAIKKEIMQLKGNFVIESHYAHDMPVDIVVILRTNPGELRKRLEERGWTKEKIEENVDAEIMEVCKTETLEQSKDMIEIDTTGKTTEDVIEEIVEHFGK